MKKNLLALSILTLLTTGCIPRTSSTVTQNSTPTLTYNTAPTPMPSRSNRPTQNNVLSSTSYHQFQTIQGPKITIGEHPAGFVFPEYQGKVVLLQIFGKECPHCFNEMPIITRLRSKFGERFQVVAIQAQEPMSRNKASELINRFHMNYPIIEKAEANNILYFLKNTYNWRGILPYGLLIKNGIIEYTYKGESDANEIQEMEEIIQGLI